MTLTDHTASLPNIGDDRLATTDPAEDVRGRTVLDNTDKHIGEVDDLLVDDREHEVRFLREAGGGFVGLGETKFLIQVDAITKVGDKAVHVDQTRDHVVTGRQYDPALMNVPYLNDIYGDCGYDPYWEPGYRYPCFPMCRVDRRQQRLADHEYVDRCKSCAAEGRYRAPQLRVRRGASAKLGRASSAVASWRMDS